MIAILSYFQLVIAKIVEILNITPFQDFPVSIFQLLCCGIFLKYVFQFIFGGFKEFDSSLNYTNSRIVSRAISNYSRKKQVNDHKPKHEAK